MAAVTPERLVAFEPLGNLTLLHVTDTHAQLWPLYYREPDTNLGVGPERGRPPHLTGQAFLDYYGYAPGSVEAYAYTHLDFVRLAAEYGQMGGYAHLATLVKQVRAERPGRTLLLDSGDTIQGSAVALWTRGEDMLAAINQLGVDVFCPHWEFTCGIDRVKELFGDRESKGRFAGDFVAQNVSDATWGDRLLNPYTVREVGGVRVGVIGQAFPFTPIAHPRRFVPDLRFGIEESAIRALVAELREKRRVDLVVLLSHSGTDVDKKMAARVEGIDVVLGGHTHDAVPRPIVVGRTLMINSGSSGKFLSRLDLDIKGGRVAGYRYKLTPVLSRAIPEDPDMAALIRRLRAPYEAKLGEVLGVADSLLYRHGNFNGTFDDLILDALLAYYDAEVALLPGFRFGASLVPGQPITLEDLHTLVGITYPNTYRREMTGEELKRILEDIADNIFHPDPYYQQGGDMVRVGELSYAINVHAPMGSRLRDIEVGGRPLEPARRYKVCGWASLGEAEGPPVYDVVAAHCRRLKRVSLTPRPTVRVL